MSTVDPGTVGPATEAPGPGATADGSAGPAPGDPPTLVVDRVSASYGPYRALFGVSFTVPAGGVVALLGSNGAGKSTVARVVSGLLPVTGGRIVLQGRDVTGLPAYKIARAGMAHVVEGRGVFANLTVAENLTLAFRQRLGRDQVDDCLERAYESFPVLGERRRQRGGTLSGGQQRLLSLAKVLVAPPKLLVADELSLGLAPVVIDAVYDSLRRIHEAGTALLVVEQQVDRVLEVADCAVVLEHGSVAFDGDATGALKAVERVLAARGEVVAAMAVEGLEQSAAERTDERPERRRRWSRRGKNRSTGEEQG
ncbi:MAG TPA: ABC transporter ATP-binding protein [Acidimicrobiales bacterium]|nr:ABC transporter ATP-binding protein [Acidimicrobiales bacterium]